MTKFKPYSSEEIDFIITNYKKISYNEIAKILNRTKSSISTKIQQLKLPPKNRYSIQEIEFIKNNYLTMTYEEMSRTINRPKSSMVDKLLSLNLPPKRANMVGDGRDWAKEEEQFLIEKYNYRNCSFLAKKLDRSYHSVRNKINMLNLSRDREELSRAPEINLTETEKAYIAGIIDGEGCLTISIHEHEQCGKTYFRFMPKLSIYNSNESLIIFLKDKLKFNSYSERRRNPSNKKLMHVSTGHKNHMRLVLNLTRPWLIVKAQLADLMLEFLDLPINRQHQNPDALFLVARFRKLQDARGIYNSKALRSLLQKLKKFDTKRVEQLELF